MTHDECVQLDHVLQMYHLGYHSSHRPSSIRDLHVGSANSITVKQMYHLGYHRGHRQSTIRELQVESETSITVQHRTHCRAWLTSWSTSSVPLGMSSMRNSTTSRRPGCSGSCPQSQRGITPSENPAQDADRYARVTTRTPGSLGAKRTKTTEATQTQR